MDQVVSGIERVGIVGCGTMGSGIAELVASHGIPVCFVERDDRSSRAASQRIERSLDQQVRAGTMSEEERDAIAGRIHGCSDLAEIANCDLVLEAVPEALDLKQGAFERIDRYLRSDAILATHTSSLPVMDIAVHSRRSNHVVGLQFFNPARSMELVELVRTPVTDEDVVTTVHRFVESLGKTPIVVGDRRGFIVNQLLFPYLNQAVWMVEGGYATKEDVDAAMRAGAKLPMGPIGLTDLIGLDTFVAVMESIHERVHDPRFAPRPLLRQLSSAGFIGRKAGRGFYTYDGHGASRTLPDADTLAAADPATIAHWRQVGVVGTGTMAAGIAEVCARAGFEVLVLGQTRERSEAVAGRVSRSLQRLVERDRLSGEDMVATIQRLKPTIEIDELGECDLVIEAVDHDDDAARRDLFARLSATVKPSTLLTTSTSSVSVIDCAMATDRPEQVVGLHFFNPAEMMQLVEVVATVRSDERTVEQARAFVERIGKVGVLCGDRAGFIVNTLLFPYLNDAVKMLESHYATTDEIDTAMKLGCGYPMGPFELMDVVGLDLTLAIIERLRDEYRQPSYEPAPLLRNLVDAGFLGRKAGRGFYVYD